jgi:hypothetical protein
VQVAQMPNMAVDQEVLVQMPEVVRVVGVRSMVVPAVAAVAVATPAVLQQGVRVEAQLAPFRLVEGVPGAR